MPRWLSSCNLAENSCSEGLKILTGVEREVGNLRVKRIARIETCLTGGLPWRAWMNRRTLAIWRRKKKKSTEREMVECQRQTFRIAQGQAEKEKERNFYSYLYS